MLKSILTFTMIAMIAVVTGCESDSDDSGGQTPTVDVTGTWHASSDNGDGTVLTLNQSGSDVSGTALGSHGDAGSCTGSVSGNELLITIVWNAGDSTTATLTMDGDQARGVFRDGDGTEGTVLAIRR